MSKVLWFDDLYVNGADTKAILFKDDSIVAIGTINDANATLSVSHSFESGGSAVADLITSGLNTIKNWASAAIRNTDGLADTIKNHALNSLSDEQKAKYFGHVDKTTGEKVWSDKDGFGKFGDILQDARSTIVDGQIINKSSKYKKFTGTSSEITVPSLTIYFVHSHVGATPKKDVITVLTANDLLGKEHDLLDHQIENSGTLRGVIGESISKDLETILGAQLIQMPPHGFSYKSIGDGSTGMLTLVTPTGIYNNLVVSAVNISYSQTCITEDKPKVTYDGSEKYKIADYSKLDKSNYFNPLYIRVELSLEYAVLPTANEVKEFLGMEKDAPDATFEMLNELIKKASADYIEKMTEISSDVYQAKNSILVDMVQTQLDKNSAEASEVKGQNFLGKLKSNLQNATQFVSGLRQDFQNSKIMEYANNANSAINKYAAIGNQVSGLVNEVTGAVSDVVNIAQSASNSITSAVSSIAGVAGSIMSGINGTISQMSNIRSSISSTMSTNGNIISNTAGNIKRIQIL